jgi:hypothetical protein
MPKNTENFKLRVYNNSNTNILDIIDAFKSIGLTLLQAEQCALIIHNCGKYDLLEGNIYNLDAIRVDLQNTYNIISEVLPIKKQKTKTLKNKSHG